MGALKQTGINSSSLPGSERILLAFASTWKDRAALLIEAMQAARPGLELWLVAEYPPPPGTRSVRWIPWFPNRTAGQNFSRTQDALRGKRIERAGVVLDRLLPYWAMRLAALRTAGMRLLLFNESMDHFSLRPGDWLQALRFLVRRLRNFADRQIHAGGGLYTQLWRLRHPHAYERPMAAWFSMWVGRYAALRKKFRPETERLRMESALPEGISVVIPSRNGRPLLERLFKSLKPELAGIAGEIIVVDNGSTDGTSAWLREHHADVEVEESARPLSFSAAVNRGIRRARFSRTFLLNNDMEMERVFFLPLLQTFRDTPDLFCATAQIFYPEEKRREETGKTIFAAMLEPGCFPVRCVAPVEGEDLTWVLYGSLGCSMYDTGKLRSLGGMDEGYRPAYVEDLDLGYRAWCAGWPTVFVSRARVLHHHRAATSRFFQPEELQTYIEVNYLRFLLTSISSPILFRRLWMHNITRLNWLAAQEPKRPWALFALRAACRGYRRLRVLPQPEHDEESVLALCAGGVARFPGRKRDPGKPLVFVLSAYLPWPLSHGGAVRMYNLMKRASGEYDTLLLAFCDEHTTPPDELLEICTEVILVRREGTHLRPMTSRPEVVEEHDQPAFRAAFLEAARLYRPALVQMEFTQMGVYARDCRPVPTVLVEHDITIDLYGQLARERGDWETREQLKRWAPFERTVWRDVSCVVTMSEKDAAMVEGARRVEVLENGVDLDRHVPGDAPPEKGRMLFVGSFAHLPNVMGLNFFLTEVWPRLGDLSPVLHVISGMNPRRYLKLYKDRVELPLPAPGVEWEAYVADVREAYRRAEIVVAPLLASAGTNIKILEAMAMGKAIVATPAAVNGIIVDPGVDVAVVDSACAMAERIRQLINTPSRRRAMERAARRSAERRYGWDEISRRQTQLYRQLIGIERAPRAATFCCVRNGR